MGYHRAGFDVTGVDIAPQPHYPFTFHLGDAMTWPLDGFDVIHASPPCQSYSTMSNRYGSSAPALIGAIRDRLGVTGVPWVIENVVGARRHLRGAVLLHGGMFGIGVYRPRLFESNVLLLAAPARRPADAAAVYGRDDRRLIWRRTDGTELRGATLEAARAAMGMDWADWHGTKEAVPPAYTEFVGGQLIG